MAQFVIAYDLDTVKMKRDGLIGSPVTQIYKSVQDHLKRNGLFRFTQQSVYITTTDVDSKEVRRICQSLLKLPKAAKYVARLQSFRVDGMVEYHA